MVKFNLPSKVIIETQALELLPSLIESYNCHSVLFVTDPNIYNIYGKNLEKTLQEIVNVSRFLITASDMTNVEGAREIARKLEACIVVGMGGGRPIDVAKYVAFLENKPFISVPTAISHDGFASPIVSLKDKDLNPMSLFTRPPDSVVIDLSVLAGAPKRLLRSGIGDLVGKITSVADARLAQMIKGEEIDEMSLYLAETAATMVLENIDEITDWSPDGLRILVEAGFLAGSAMSIAGSSRPCSGSEHLFSHAIDKVYPERRSLHGEQVGVGTIMMAYLHGLDWEAIRDALRMVGAPTNARELGIPDTKIVEALTIAHSLRKRYTILGESGLTLKAAKKLARKTGVITS